MPKRRRKHNRPINLSELLNKEIKKVSEIPSMRALVQAREFDGDRHVFAVTKLCATLGRDVASIVESYCGKRLPKFTKGSESYKMVSKWKAFTLCIVRFLCSQLHQSVKVKVAVFDYLKYGTLFWDDLLDQLALCEMQVREDQTTGCSVEIVDKKEPWSFERGVRWLEMVADVFGVVDLGYGAEKVKHLRWNFEREQNVWQLWDRAQNKDHVVVLAQGPTIGQALRSYIVGRDNLKKEKMLSYPYIEEKLNPY